MGVDYSTPDFNKFRKTWMKIQRKFKKIQNIDTRINEIIKSMERSLRISLRNYLKSPLDMRQNSMI